MSDPNAPPELPAENEPETSDALRLAAEVPDDEVAADATGPLIFISYRVHPDQQIAAALKELVESSFTPTPRVFVSGLGGLRPSSIGFKPQIQQAVQAAKAFIGVITPASKDREWIFFEAGAAFGRQALYLPVLVNATPDDLPSTIADYQACRAADREEVERSLSSVASQIGCDMRQQFGKRFARFQRRLEDFRKATAAVAEKDPLGKAIDAWLDGRGAEADSILEEREAQLVNEPDELAKVKVFRLQMQTDLKTVDVLAGMNEFAPALQATATFAYWRGLLEPRPSVAISELRKAIALSDGRAMNIDAHGELLKRLYGAGHVNEALEHAVDKLRSSDRKLRETCATFLCGLSDEIAPETRMLIAVSAAAAVPSGETLSVAEAAAESFGSDWLWFFLAESTDRQAGTGRSANQLGRILARLGLHSLAFQAYARAATKGVSVAKVNQAYLLGQFPVAAAGVAILDQHSGAFDAASPKYPHETRADLEGLLSDERGRATSLRERGNQLFEMLAELAERTIVESTQRPSCTHVELDAPGGKLLLSLTAGNSNSLCASACHPLPTVFSYQRNDGAIFIIGFDSAGAPLALTFPREGDGRPLWVNASPVDLPSIVAAAFGQPDSPLASE